MSKGKETVVLFLLVVDRELPYLLLTLAVCAISLSYSSLPSVGPSLSPTSEPPSLAPSEIPRWVDTCLLKSGYM